MNKTLLIFIITIMLFTTSCSNAKLENKTQTDPQNDSIILAVEDNQPEEIQITLDNWSNYFDVIQEDIWEENAFGEAEVLRISQTIKLKEEYANKVDAYSTNVAFEITAFKSLENIEIDFENRSYSYLGTSWEEYSGETVLTGVVSGESYPIFSCCDGYLTIDGVDVSNIEVLQNVVISRVQGCLFLYQ